MSEELKQKILSRVEKDLVAIEEELEANLNPYLDLVRQIAHHIMFSGGKRLRPLLMVLSASLCGLHGAHLKKFSVIFEYLHAATLLHDDLVDGAAIRRGKPVAHSVWDNSSAVRVGDFLLARSLSLAAQTEKPKVISVIADITENMSQGEIHQLMKKGNMELTEAEYMEVIRRKTAVLFQGACRVSAILAGVSHAREMALSSYGLNLGLAFQMTDDLLDYTQDSAALGKLTGADLREGKLTLPLIVALEKASEEHRERMENMIRRKDFSDDDFRQLVVWMNRYDGIGHTRRKAADHIRKAKNELVVFEESEAKAVLMDIADYALVRKL